MNEQTVESAMPRRKTLYLVDGSGQFHRAYHAIRGLATSRGLPTNATYGFTTMLRKLMNEDFLNKAPKDVVQKEKEKYDAFLKKREKNQENLKKLHENLDNLGGKIEKLEKEQEDFQSQIKLIENLNNRINIPID